MKCVSSSSSAAALFFLGQILVSTAAEIVSDVKASADNNNNNNNLRRRIQDGDGDDTNDGFTVPQCFNTDDMGARACDSPFYGEIPCCPGLECVPDAGCYSDKRQEGEPCDYGYGGGCTGTGCCDASRGLICDISTGKYASIWQQAYGECIKIGGGGCPAGFNGLYPTEGCTGFFFCNAGMIQGVPRQCSEISAGTLFDVESQICVPSYQVKCDVKVQPAQPRPAPAPAPKPAPVPAPKPAPAPVPVQPAQPKPADSAAVTNAQSGNVAADGTAAAKPTESDDFASAGSTDTGINTLIPDPIPDDWMLAPDGCQSGTKWRDWVWKNGDPIQQMYAAVPQCRFNEHCENNCCVPFHFGFNACQDPAVIHEHQKCLGSCSK